jgi:hypothetical protein
MRADERKDDDIIDFVPEKRPNITRNINTPVTTIAAF